MKPIHEAGEISPEGSQNVSDTMNVYGTYVHGVFDGEGIAKSVVEALLAKKGMKPDDIKTINFNDYKSSSMIFWQIVYVKILI